MKFSYTWLKEMAKFRETPAELADFLTLRVFEVESVEKKGEDHALDVKILANRMSDASGHAGLAREIAALKNLKIKRPPATIKETVKRAASFLKIVIEDHNDCSRYTARVIEGIRIGKSPQWLAERLEVCGIQSINNVVDAANYIMLETGQPLHVFDFDTLKSKNTAVKTITVRRARAGEKLLALDDKTYELRPNTLVIADDADAIAIAGIKGGKNSSVSEHTKRIVLESANFDQALIRQASRTLGIKTDASLRFEHGLDPNETESAIDKLAAFIRKLAGGSILKGRIDAYPRKTPARSIPLRTEYANQLMGDVPAPAFIEQALSRLGWKFSKKKQGLFAISPPSNRRDIEIEEDIIEEIARIRGYENIHATLPHIPLAAAERNDEIWWEERVRDHLANAGFFEHIPYEFTGETELNLFGIRQEDVLELENPANRDSKYLVPRISAAYASAAARNTSVSAVVRLFGIAKSFLKDPTGAIEERKSLILTLANQNMDGIAAFYELKGALESLIEGLGIADHWYDDTIENIQKKEEFKIFHPYRLAEIKVGNEKLGNIGQIHPAIAEKLKSRGVIAIAEINFEMLWQEAEREVEYRPESKFPTIIRDIAVIVPYEIKTDDILNAIEASAGELLRDADLFDYFQDESMRKKEQKSLAFHLIFQSPKRTLTDKEADGITAHIIAMLEDKKWIVRK